jgi:hypothetical protein
MSAPAVALVTLGCFAYLGIGFGAAMALTMDGPSEWWIRVPLRILITFGWPLLLLAPIVGALFS